VLRDLADRRVGIAGRKGPAARSPQNAASPREPETAPCRIGRLWNPQFQQLRLLSFPPSLREIGGRTPRSGVRSDSAVAKIPVAIDPRGPTCRGLRTDGEPKPAQPVSCPRELEAQYRQPEGDHDDSRPRSDNHGKTDEQHGTANKEHGNASRNPVCDIEDGFHCIATC